MTVRTERHLPVSSPAPDEEIRQLVDDAHATLPPEALAEVLLAASQAIETPDASGKGDGPRPGGRPAASREVRAYLGLIERLARGQARRARPLPASRRGALLSYIEDVAARPRGAALPA